MDQKEISAIFLLETQYRLSKNRIILTPTGLSPTQTRLSYPKPGYPGLDYPYLARITNPRVPRLMDLYFSSIASIYDCISCVWSSSPTLAESGSKGSNLFNVPSFEDLREDADVVDVAGVSGKIIGLFTLKKKTTIIVQPECGNFSVLSTRNLLKKESVKLSNAVKKVSVRPLLPITRTVLGQRASLGLFELSVSVPSGHVCNFTGIQHSSLYINAGAITNDARVTDTLNVVPVHSLVESEPQDLATVTNAPVIQSQHLHSPASSSYPEQVRQRVDRRLFPDTEYLSDTCDGMIIYTHHLTRFFNFRICFHILNRLTDSITSRHKRIRHHDLPAIYDESPTSVSVRQRVFVTPDHAEDTPGTPSRCPMRQLTAATESAPSSPEDAARSLEISHFLARNLNSSSSGLVNTGQRYILPAGLTIRVSREEQQSHEQEPEFSAY